MTTPTMMIMSMITTATTIMAGMEVVPVDVSNKDCGMSKDVKQMIKM